ncbi:MAG: response regulator [Anaerolineae bacterium]|nr:response regulator [Anaerolineae bacterium]
MSETNSLLIIDDDILTAQLYQTLLEHAGYNVVLAASTREAAQILIGIEVDAIVLDYELPDENGLYWLRHLRDNPRYADLPVILVSSIPRDEDLTHDPFVWFMEKPRQPQHIVTAVESTLALFT